MDFRSSFSQQSLPPDHRNDFHSSFALSHQSLPEVPTEDGSSYEPVYQFISEDRESRPSELYDYPTPRCQHVSTTSDVTDDTPMERGSSDNAHPERQVTCMDQYITPPALVQNTDTDVINDRLSQ